MFLSVGNLWKNSFPQPYEYESMRLPVENYFSTTMLLTLGPLKCPYSMSTTQTKMTSTYQLNALDISYNGWNNYETWNVALWINNTEGLYHLAQECGCYEEFVKCLPKNAKTRDGVRYNDPKVNVVQLNSDVFDF